jgi:DNA-directed RNA polymerase subunit omega
MRDDYLRNACAVIPDTTILINVVSRRVKQLRRGYRPLVESLEKLAPEDIALREIVEGKISYELAKIEEVEYPAPRRHVSRSTTPAAPAPAPAKAAAAAPAKAVAKA